MADSHDTRIASEIEHVGANKLVLTDDLRAQFAEFEEPIDKMVELIRRKPQLSETMLKLAIFVCGVIYRLDADEDEAKA